MIITPLSSACAAEFKGLDLSKKLARKTVKQIEQAWHQHLVVVIRNQNLTPEMQMTFARSSVPWVKGEDQQNVGGKLMIMMA